MKIINNQQDFEQMAMLKFDRDIGKPVLTVETDDDVTINFKIWDKTDFELKIKAKNIIFNEDVFVEHIYADGNITSLKELAADNITAKKITAKNIDVNYLTCTELKAEKIASHNSLVVTNISCDFLYCEKFACDGIINIKNFFLGGLILFNLYANNEELAQKNKKK